MMARFSIGTVFAAGVGCVLLASSNLQAAFGTPTWTRPTTLGQATTDNTTYQSWNVFSDDDINTVNVIEDSAPDVANINPNGNATVYEPGNGFLTGGGNLYSPTGILDITATIPTGTFGPGVTKFFVQLKTLGSELVSTNYPTVPALFDYSNFKIDGLSVAAMPDFSYTEISRASLGAMGYSVEHAFTFTLPGTGTSHVFNYKPLSSSSSQDLLSIDTQVVVPEPASLGLVGLGALALVRRRRVK